MLLRAYEPADCPALLRLFYDTVHAVCAADYTAEQLDAWATGREDAAAWDRSLRAHRTLVAVLSGEIAGFAACTQEELAWLYVDPAHFRKGVGRVLGEVLSGNAPAKALYARLGFVTAATERGRMPGNEAFSVQVDCMERR